jgi:hypothetical protein
MLKIQYNKVFLERKKVFSKMFAKNDLSQDPDPWSKIVHGYDAFTAD